MYSFIQGEIYEQAFLIKGTSNEVIYNYFNFGVSLLAGNYKKPRAQVISSAANKLP